MQRSNHVLIQQARDGVKLLVSGALAAIQAEDMDLQEQVRETRRLMDEIVGGLLQLDVDCRLLEMVELVEHMQSLRQSDWLTDEMLEQFHIAEGAWHAHRPMACRHSAAFPQQPLAQE